MLAIDEYRGLIHYANMLRKHLSLEDTRFSQLPGTTPRQANLFSGLNGTNSCTHGWTRHYLF